MQKIKRTSLVLAILFLAPAAAQRAPVSNKPETPFKLATFEAKGKIHVGLTAGSRLIDAADASAYLTGSHINVDGGWLAYGGW